MAELKSDFTPEDMNLLMEAVEIYEKRGSELLAIIEHFKNMAPLPTDTPSDVAEYVNKLKDHYLSKEKEAKKTQEVGRERTTLVKAKIIMQKQDLAINSL